MIRFHSSKIRDFHWQFPFSRVSRPLTLGVTSGQGLEPNDLELDPPPSLFQSKSRTLANGLEVIVVEDFSIARVSVGVLYKVGSADDPDHLVGLSHMTEHMFFHGSELFPDIGATLAEKGGSINACTSEDFTLYTSDAPSSALEKIFEAEADRMGRFELKNEEIFQKEQMAVFEERLMCVENPPLGLIDEYVQASLWPQHPYGKEIIGSRRNIQAYTSETVNNHYKTWYKPNNAVLIVIGAATAERVFDLAEYYFGWIERGEVPTRQRPQNALCKDVHHVVTYNTDKVATPKIEFLFHAPHHSVNGLEDEIAFKIGLESLFGSRVFSFLRYFEEEKELVASLDVDWEESLDPYLVNISAQLMPTISVGQFQEEFFNQLKKVIKEGLRQEEFDRAKRGFATDSVYQIQDGHDKIRMFFVRLAMGYSLEQLESIPQIIQNTTNERVCSLLTKTFSIIPFAQVLLSPATETLA